MKFTDRHTTVACYFGMISQAIVNNLAPILFIIFKESFGISDEQLGRLILFNFGTQIAADVIATQYVDRVGYRVSATAAHACCALGLILMGVLPGLMNDAYAGLCVAAVVYALGGGIIEVVISPIIESLPGEQKAKAMSLAHSFYCWGQLLVVLLTTLALRVFGGGIWRVLALCWAIVPLANLCFFTRVPLKPTVSESARTSLQTLLGNRVFLISMLMMICSGSAELTMSQWASLFAEQALGVSKLVGDLLGPCMFALTMGLGRAYFGVRGDKIQLEKALMLTSAFCVVCYLLAVFVPPLSLLGCAMCGLSVSLMWPGTLSSAAVRFPLGGTMMFGVLAVCGDIGCSFGPWLAGLVSDLTQASPRMAAFAYRQGLSIEAVGLKSGLLAGIIFPVLLLLGAFLLMREAVNRR